MTNGRFPFGRARLSAALTSTPLTGEGMKPVTAHVAPRAGDAPFARAQSRPGIAQIGYGPEMIAVTFHAARGYIAQTVLQTFSI